MLSIIIIKYMIQIYISIKKVIVKGIQLHGNKTYTHFFFVYLSLKFVVSLSSQISF